MFVDLTKTLRSGDIPNLFNEYEVKFVNNHIKHCVVRKKDNERILKGFDTELLAQTAMAEYIRTVTNT